MLTKLGSLPLHPQIDLRIRRSIFLIFAALLSIVTNFAAATTVSPNSSSDDSAMKLATHICSNCHGPGGNSVSPTFPRLAGQQAAYIVANLQAFKSGKRKEKEAYDYMLGITNLIDPPTAEALARYYSHQPVQNGVSEETAEMAAGNKIFEQGIPGQVVACATCHGAHAEGNNIFPRLAGQHAQYIVRQLTVIQRGLRESPVMYGIIKNLKPEDMKNVAAYLESR